MSEQAKADIAKLKVTETLWWHVAPWYVRLIFVTAVAQSVLRLPENIERVAGWFS